MNGSATARRAVWLLLLPLVLGVTAQDLVNGGEVALACEVCECLGTSDDGTITVFQNPSSGDPVSKRQHGFPADINEITWQTKRQRHGNTTTE